MNYELIELSSDELVVVSLAVLPSKRLVMLEVCANSMKFSHAHPIS